MRNILVLIILLFGQYCNSQTVERIIIPGTKCSMIPPKDFSLATTFGGFQNIENGASIMINEFPAPYNTIADGFTEQDLLEKGMQLISKKKIEFNQSEATWIEVSQSAYGIIYLKQILIFGNETYAVLANGIYPKTAKKIKNKIEDALLSITYNPLQEENALDAANFSINTDGTDFEFIKYMSGSLLYSVDDKIPTEQPTLIIGNSFIEVPKQEQKEYAETRIKSYPKNKNVIIKKINEVIIDKLSGYEIIADSKTEDNSSELIYQTMLFDEDGKYFIIAGFAKEKFGNYIDSFQKITNTFRRK